MLKKIFMLSSLLLITLGGLAFAPQESHAAAQQYRFKCQSCSAVGIWTTSYPSATAGAKKHANASGHPVGFELKYMTASLAI